MWKYSVEILLRIREAPVGRPLPVESNEWPCSYDTCISGAGFQYFRQTPC